jgi:ribosomal protein S12 methylthiotransferase accessory factor
MFNKNDFSARKTFMNGTDRLVPPAETLERVKPYFEKLGITRVANVTGLDHIGIPVVMAVRPNSRSLSVTQGKGLSLDAAKVSAIMESLEYWHAENLVIPIHLDTAAKLSESSRVVTLPDDAFSPIGGNWRSIEIPWVQAHQISDGDPVFVPHDFVHFDTRPDVQNGPSSKIFARGIVNTNGLASGNNLLEAANHAISELIERDAYYKWKRMTKAERMSTSVNLETVDDADCNWMLDRILTAGFKPLVEDITSDVNVPAFRCAIGADPKYGIRPEPFFPGWGCHPRREIALLRAISEAAQTRLTMISGSRDDLYRTKYLDLQDRSKMIKEWEYVSKVPATRDFMEVPTYTNDTFEADTSILLHQLERVGISEVLIVDLTHREIGIPVAKVICPALNYGRRHG